jgi:ADP-ribose pyrophosphatase YjhB (NUDIX family)
MKRDIRYQAAIIKDDRVLLLRVLDRLEEATFWLLPGGGREDGESEEDCVRREVEEETSLQIHVERLLFERPDIREGMYKSLQTYLCYVVRGEALPGSEPEIDTEEQPAIQEVRWFDLREPASWDPAVIRDPLTYPELCRLREVLGYI